MCRGDDSLSCRHSVTNGGSSAPRPGGRTLSRSSVSNCVENSGEACFIISLDTSHDVADPNPLPGIIFAEARYAIAVGRSASRCFELSQVALEES